jgi:hypothetical protein
LLSTSSRARWKPSTEISSRWSVDLWHNI